MEAREIVTIAISLVIIAIILPIGIGNISTMGEYVMVLANITGANESAIFLSDVVDPSVLVILTVVLPIIVVIGIALAYLRSANV